MSSLRDARRPGRKDFNRTMPPLPDDYAVAFSLPRGLRVGGVEVWTVKMAAELARRGRRSVLLNHRPGSDGGTATTAVIGDVSEKRRRYREALPAVLVPNFTLEPYDLCAALSQTDADRMRVIGMCHTYHEYLFFTLAYFEPIVHRFVAVSRECADVLRARMPHRADDVVVRPYGVEVPEALERDYSPPERPLRLLYAGRIVQVQKRVFDLVTLAEAMERLGVDFHLDVVGDGRDEPALRRRVGALPERVRRRVVLHPGVPPQRMPQLIREHDACVLVSAYEGTSIFMLESLAGGCVPVVTRVSGTGDVIRPGENGFVVEVGDVEGMAQHLAELSGDRERLGRIGRAAHADARAFSMQGYVGWFQETCAEVWRQPPRTWPGGRPLGLRLRRGFYRAAETARGFLHRTA